MHSVSFLTLVHHVEVLVPGGVDGGAAEVVHPPADVEAGPADDQVDPILAHKHLHSWELPCARSEVLYRLQLCPDHRLHQHLHAGQPPHLGQGGRLCLHL